MHARLTPTSPRVQRKCDCTAGGDCGCGGKKKVRKKSRAPSTDDLFEEEADRFAARNAAHLDVHHPQLAGHDFSHVRIHDDAHAHARADEENARAFTYGSDIYFARGELARPDARQLLAHELAHTVQQGAATTVRRKDAGGCDEPQRLILDQAGVRAYFWVLYAIKRLDRYIAKPDDHPSTKKALADYFSTDSEYVTALSARLAMIRDGLRSQGKMVPVHCSEDPRCLGSTLAYEDNEEIFVCKKVLQSDEEKIVNSLATVLIHEAAHAFAPNLGNIGMAADLAYVGTRLFRELTPEEAFQNAESYAMFVQAMAGEETYFTLRPEDDIAGCGPDRGKVTRSLAEVQLWNREIVDGLKGMDQASFDSSYGSMFPVRPRVESVQRVFSRMSATLERKQTATCAGNTPQCAGNIAYWGTDPKAQLQICPEYFGIPEEKRSVQTFRLMLQYNERISMQQAAPYVDMLRTVASIHGAPRLPLTDPTTRVLDQDKSAYTHLVILAGQAVIALSVTDPPKVRSLVHELESNLLAPNMILRFNGTSGSPPRYSPLTNTLVVPSSGLSDGELMLGLLRETERMRQASEMPASPQAQPSEGMAVGELVPMQTGLIDVLARAGLVTDRPAAQAASAQALKAEIDTRTAAARTTIFAVTVDPFGDALLRDGSRDGLDLGTLRVAARTPAEVEQSLRVALRTRAAKPIEDAAQQGSTTITVRVFQTAGDPWTFRKFQEFVLVP